MLLESPFPAATIHFCAFSCSQLAPESCQMSLQVSFAHRRRCVADLFLRGQDGRLELRGGHDHAHKIALAVIIATIAVQILNDNLSKSQSPNSIQDHIKNKIIPTTIVTALIDIFNSVTSIINLLPSDQSAAPRPRRRRRAVRGSSLILPKSPLLRHCFCNTRKCLASVSCIFSTFCSSVLTSVFSSCSSRNIRCNRLNDVCWH